MTNPTPATPVAAVKADPKRPYKAYAAAVLAFLGLLWANLQGVEDWGTLDFQDWVTIVVPTILTFGATYYVKNPKVLAVPRHLREGGYALLGALGVGIVVLTILLVVLTLLKVVAISWVVLVVLFVIGLVLCLLDGGLGRRRAL